MSPRVTASDRFRRIVAIVPWIAERDGPTVDEVCAQFGVDRSDLLADLDVVFMVGIPPYTPDELIDVIIDDDRIWIRLGRYFTRPLRLSAQEAFAVLAAGAGLLATPGTDPSGPLARSLDKLGRAAGIDTAGALEVSLGGADAETLATLQEGAAQRRCVEIDYYTYSTDENTLRTIDPYRVYATDGNWYVTGWCHHATGERVFRVDRVRSARFVKGTFELPEQMPEPTSYAGSGTDPRVVLELDPSARWVTEHYPVESVTELGEGRFRVVLTVGGDAWLERLLLRLGPEALVVDPPDDLGDRALTAVEAQQIVGTVVDEMIARYR